MRSRSAGTARFRRCAARRRLRRRCSRASRCRSPRRAPGRRRVARANPARAARRARARRRPRRRTRSALRRDARRRRPCVAAACSALPSACAQPAFDRWRARADRRGRHRRAIPACRAVCRHRARRGTHRARRRRRPPAGARQAARRARIVRRHLLAVQRLHRAEATAVFVGQVAGFLRVADDRGRDQHDDFGAVALAGGLRAEQAADDRDPATGQGTPDEPRVTPSLIRPASMTVSPLWIAASVFNRRVSIADVGRVARRRALTGRTDFLHEVEEHHAVLGDARAHLQDRAGVAGTAPG